MHLYGREFVDGVGELLLALRRAGAPTRIRASASSSDAGTTPTIDNATVSGGGACGGGCGRVCAAGPPCSYVNPYACEYAVGGSASACA